MLQICYLLITFVATKRCSESNATLAILHQMNFEILAYVRYNDNINLQNVNKAANYVDILNRSLDTKAANLMGDLRDVRLSVKVEEKYTIECIGREGLDIESHDELNNSFIGHFYNAKIRFITTRCYCN